MNIQFKQVSLQRKITLAYLILVFSSALLGVVAYSDLLFLEQQLMEGEVIADLKANVLEMRREEKNIFLYSEQKQLENIQEYIQASLTILNKNNNLIKSLTKSNSTNVLLQFLDRYQNLFKTWEMADNTKRMVIAEKIREIGHEISLIVQSLSIQERSLLRGAVQKSQLILLVSVLLIGLSIYLVGRQLKKVVVTPIKELEKRLKPIAEGRFKRLSPPSADREFITFTEAFNRMLKELEIRQKAMLQSEKLASLGILASGVAHELNNPLSNISSSCQLLIEELNDADEEQLYVWLNQIDSETERGKSIVKTLLNFGSQRTFQKMPLNLLKHINKTKLILQKLITQHNASLTVNIADDITIFADQQRIQQLIINIIQNALLATKDRIVIEIAAKYCHRCITAIENSAEIVGNLECMIESDSRYVEICITDSGPGIPDSIISKIFDPFFTTREPGRGVGLGLYIVKEIVTEHNGCLAVFSGAESGTKVTIILPENEVSCNE